MTTTPEELEQRLKDLGDRVLTLTKSMSALQAIITMQDEAMEDVRNRLTFTERLAAFFGPMLEGKNPPLDGEQVASKAFVDTAIGRIAGVIREEIRKESDKVLGTSGIQLRMLMAAEKASLATASVYEDARVFIRELEILLQTRFGAISAVEAAAKVANAVKQLEAIEHLENQPGPGPSRLVALIYALTGVDMEHRRTAHERSRERHLANLRARVRNGASS